MRGELLNYAARRVRCAALCDAGVVPTNAAADLLAQAGRMAELTCSAHRAVGNHTCDPAQFGAEREDPSPTSRFDAAFLVDPDDGAGIRGFDRRRAQMPGRSRRSGADSEFHGD